MTEMEFLLTKKANHVDDEDKTTTLIQETDSNYKSKTVMAGSFLGMDDFCVSKRIYGRPEQMVCICDESGIRCSYNVPLR